MGQKTTNTYWCDRCNTPVNKATDLYQIVVYPGGIDGLIYHSTTNHANCLIEQELCIHCVRVIATTVKEFKL